MSQFGFRASPANQIQSASVSSPRSQLSGSALSSSTTAVTSSVPLGARSGSPSGSPHQPPPPPPPPASSAGGGGGGGGLRCCDTGRPLFTDPLTGQSVCSCQYDILSYQRLASGVGAGGIPALSMYTTPYSAEGMAAYFPALGADQAPFYTSSAAGLELKENLAAGAAGWPYPSVYHPYDAAFAGYPFNGYGMDLNGARRKNATRETTSTLKAWLNEHKKNPYPTKGEKIMLAIITKMTLTQVSTWFANARRRLKKENKMTWEPRNRVEDEDNNNDDESGRKSADNAKDPDSKDSGTGSSEDGDRHRLEILDRPCGGVGMDTGSEWSESRPDSGPDSPECLFERPLHSAYHLHHPHTRHPSPPPPPTAATPSKPRIWSLADMASKESDVHHMSPPVTTSAFYSGKLISPLANRGFHPAATYARPHPDFYRSLYGSHLAGASGGAPGEASLLETYSRTFGPGGHHGNGTPLSAVLSKAAVMAAAAASAAPPPPPFSMNGGASLTVAAPGASSSSSSGSSVTDHQLQHAGLHTAVTAKLSPVEVKPALNKA